MDRASNIGEMGGPTGTEAGQNAPFRRLLVALDGSDASSAILPDAVGLATLSGAELVLATVLPPPAPGPASAEPAALEGAAASLRHQVDVARESCPRVSSALLRGDPADQLIAYAAGNGVDLIAMATRARWDEAGLPAESVADAVARGAPVPLLLRRVPLRRGGRWRRSRPPARRRPAGRLQARRAGAPARGPARGRERRKLAPGAGDRRPGRLRGVWLRRPRPRDGRAARRPRVPRLGPGPVSRAGRARRGDGAPGPAVGDHHVGGARPRRGPRRHGHPRPLGRPVASGWAAWRSRCSRPASRRSSSCPVPAPRRATGARPGPR